MALVGSLQRETRLAVDRRAAGHRDLGRIAASGQTPPPLEAGTDRRFRGEPHDCSHGVGRRTRAAAAIPDGAVDAGRLGGEPAIGDPRLLTGSGINGLTLSNNHYGIYSTNSTLVFDGFASKSNTYGAWLTTSNVTIKNSTFTGSTNESLTS